MSTNWSELRKELKTIKKETTTTAGKSNSRKRKIISTENKWKKARAEIKASTITISSETERLIFCYNYFYYPIFYLIDKHINIRMVI